MLYDFRRFSTYFKKLPIEFLVYKDSYPLRSESLTMINIVIQNSKLKSQILLDEVVKSLKKNKIILHELFTIKNSVKGDKVHAVFMLINMILINDCKELINDLINEKGVEYLSYALSKDSSLSKRYPEIVKFCEVPN